MLSIASGELANNIVDLTPVSYGPGFFYRRNTMSNVPRVFKETQDQIIIQQGRTDPLKESIKGVSNIQNIGFQKGEALITAEYSRKYGREVESV